MHIFKRRSLHTPKGEKKNNSVILEALRNTLRAADLLGSDSHGLGLLHSRPWSHPQQEQATAHGPVEQKGPFSQNTPTYPSDI